MNSQIAKLGEGMGMSQKCVTSAQKYNKDMVVDTRGQMKIGSWFTSASANFANNTSKTEQGVRDFAAGCGSFALDVHKMAQNMSNINCSIQENTTIVDTSASQTGSIEIKTGASQAAIKARTAMYKIYMAARNEALVIASKTKRAQARAILKALKLDKEPPPVKSNFVFKNGSIAVKLSGQFKVINRTELEEDDQFNESTKALAETAAQSELNRVVRGNEGRSENSRRVTAHVNNIISETINTRMKTRLTQMESDFEQTGKIVLNFLDTDVEFQGSDISIDMYLDYCSESLAKHALSVGTEVVRDVLSKSSSTSMETLDSELASELAAIREKVGTAQTELTEAAGNSFAKQVADGKLGPIIVVVAAALVIVLLLSSGGRRGGGRGGGGGGGGGGWGGGGRRRRW